MSRPRYEVADVIAHFGNQFTVQCQPNKFQEKTLRALTLCRTAELGWHKEECDCCKKIRISYNSCGNRHCPKCQASKQAFWIEDLLKMILPVKHYHMVFTVPHEVNAICMLDSAWFYNHLFSAVWSTLQSFGYTHYGVESGAVCVLHTWGQNLSLHPHVHCIVPAAGLSLAGHPKHIGKGGKYLYPVTAVSDVFKGKLMESVKRQLVKKQLWQTYKQAMNVAWNKKWVVFCEPSFGKPEHVVAYLGNYTHRVAISNHRIMEVNDDGVTFMHKDYVDGAKQKPITLTGVEFLRRFCQHFLPQRFVKIRYYGIYSSRFRALQKKENTKMVLKPPKETSRERLKRLTGFDVTQCPFCHKGIMHLIEVMPRIRSPVARTKQVSIVNLCF